jgi:O-antigen ligase
VLVFLSGSIPFAFLSFLGMESIDIESTKKLESLIALRMKIPRINFKLQGAEEGFNPNAIGGILVLLIPLFVFAFYLIKKKRSEQSIIVNNIILISVSLFLILEIIVLLFILSRTSWLAMHVSCFVIIYILLHRKIKKGTIFLMIVSMLLLFCLFYIFLMGLDDIKEGGTDIIRKALHRKQAWTVGVSSIRKHPLTGIGLNRIRLEEGIGYGRAHVHNHLIHTASELGIPALVAYLAILIGSGYMCCEVWKKTKVDWMRMAVLGLGSGQLAHFIFGLGDSIPLGAKTGFIFWLSLALITSIYNYSIHDYRAHNEY